MASSNVNLFDGQIGNVVPFAPATLTGDVTLTDAAGYNDNVIKLDPGGASRNVTLWSEASKKGVRVLFVNGADAAENLVLKDPAGNTVATVNQNEAAMVQSNGTAWIRLFVMTIALS